MGHPMRSQELSRLAVLALLTVLAARAATSVDAPSVHGMLIVGESTVFLSHLPMFHPPHDYQLILNAKLPGASGPERVRTRARREPRPHLPGDRAVQGRREGGGAWGPVAGRDEGRDGLLHRDRRPESAVTKTVGAGGERPEIKSWVRWLRRP